jgi:hypothetical protein
MPQVIMIGWIDNKSVIFGRISVANECSCQCLLLSQLLLMFHAANHAILIKFWHQLVICCYVATVYFNDLCQSNKRSGILINGLARFLFARQETVLGRQE